MLLEEDRLPGMLVGREF